MSFVRYECLKDVFYKQWLTQRCVENIKYLMIIHKTSFLRHECLNYTSQDVWVWDCENYRQVFTHSSDDKNTCAYCCTTWRVQNFPGYKIVYVYARICYHGYYFCCCLMYLWINKQTLQSSTEVFFVLERP